jgi:hypothetical protein
MTSIAMFFGRTCCLLGIILAIVPECQAVNSASERRVGASVITLEWGRPFGAPQRPEVEFDHGKHTEALGGSECKACHPSDAEGRRLYRFGRVDDAGDADAQRELYHDRCMTCHKERTGLGKKSGPTVCGECHVAQPGPVSTRDRMGFDYSLHYRHVLGMDDKCEACHHVYNEASRTLEYVKGESEDACGDCHRNGSDGSKLSLRAASHQSCVNCHLERRDSGLEGGPVRCVGCHDAEVVDGYSRLPDAEIARLKGKQPDGLWIAAIGADSKAVGFDHKAHEPRARFCTTCHHMTRKPCRACHTQAGKPEGGRVTVEGAHHLVSSERSCVGCHASEAASRDCSGCHGMPGDGMSREACGVCHKAGVDTRASAIPVYATELSPLPASSDDEFPETVMIKTLAETYEPSEMPHRKIVARLDEIVRGSKLARTFHGQTETLCAGCHHHSPPDVRPGPCGACHSGKADPVKDRPSLKAAYHRQCMGCHQRMEIAGALACTECHAKVAKEVSQ